MRNIIYKSENIIPWDTQSAFKMNSYTAQVEEHMVFCYLKSYVHGGNLVLCSYCFTEHPQGKDNIHLYLNLSPDKNGAVMQIDYGYDGMGKIVYDKKEITGDGISLNCFKTDDEQGFYWCGEITVDKAAVNQLWNTDLEEKSIFTLNMTQTFENGDFSGLFGDVTKVDYLAENNMNVFLVLNY